ncbi:MAG: chorismate mutase [Clostridia bacterium]|nr:chorismate mutase [Clostridia bacterium]
MSVLDEARLEIDRVDGEMRRLFQERMAAVEKVAAYKKEHGLQIFDAAREEAVVEKNAAQMDDPAVRPYYVTFLRQTMAVSRQYQRRLLDGMRVAYAGVIGAFGEIAAKRAFPGAVPVPYASFKEAYEAVAEGRADLAVLPLENSVGGDVGQVMDLIYFGELFVAGVCSVTVEQHLLGLPGATEEGVKTVISHPQALAQCASFLQSRGWAVKERANTAEAAREVAESGDLSLAAVGSEEAAAAWGLVKLASHINEAADNTTRFAVLTRARKDPEPKDDRFLLLFTVKNEAGGLARAITAIGAHGYNMRALKSRPNRDLAWNYYFFCECEGDIHDSEGRALMRELAVVCQDVKIAGYYDKDLKL